MKPRGSFSNFLVVTLAGSTIIRSTIRNPHRKELKPITMKYLAIIALAAVAFSIGACASKPAPAPMSSSSSTGYSK